MAPAVEALERGDEHRTVRQRGGGGEAERRLEAGNGLCFRHVRRLLLCCRSGQGNVMGGDSRLLLRYGWKGNFEALKNG